MRRRPIMIAVGGDSGTGKTTLCAGLDAIFGAARIQTVCLDDYHALDRAQRAAVGLTALDPRANNFAAMEEDLWTLREGGTVRKPVYDHADGTIGGPETVAPKDIVVVQGLFPLYTRALRGLFDVTVWLDPETELKVAWKIQRDVAQRGYTADQVRAEIERRQPDIRAHIAPQRAYAHLTVRFSRPPTWQTNPDNAHLTAQIRKSDRFPALDYREFARSSQHVRQLEETTASGRPETIVELDGQIADDVAVAMQDKIWSSMDSHAHLRPDRLGTFSDPRGSRVSHSLALAQLLVARRVCLVENELRAAA